MSFAVLIAQAITTISAPYGADPVLMQALSNVEIADGKLISDPNSDGSRDWGPMQVNDRTLPLLGGKWADMSPQDLVDDPVQGVEAGLIIFRWRVYESLTHHAIVVPPRAGGGPDYVAQAAILQHLPGPVWDSVMKRALAGYNGGDVAMRDWPNVRPVVVAYVNAVWREYEKLQEERKSARN